LVKARSDIGLVRTNNQDSAYVSPSMIALADGMGGAAAGDLASAVAITALMAQDGQPGRASHRLRTAIANAHSKLSDLIAWNPSLSGLGTTIEAAVFTGSTMSLAHLGDSRVYLLREHELTRLTHDHSLVQQLLDSGEITEEEAEYHPRRSLLMRVLNGTYVFKPVLSNHALQLGDRLLFCSDGLSGQLDDDDIVSLLGDPDTNKTITSLKTAVYDLGAPDNVTIVVADVVEANAELDAAAPQLFGAVAKVVIPDVPHFGFPDNVPQDMEDTGWFDLPPDPETQESDIGARRSLRSSKSRELEPVKLDDDNDRPQKRGLLVGISVLVAVLALLLAGLWGGQRYLSSQFFIGDDDGQVAIFQGLPERVVGIELNWVAETSNTSLSDLPTFYADQVRGGNLRPADLASARVTLSELEAKAAYCRSLRVPTGAPSATPTPPTANTPPVQPTESTEPTESATTAPTAAQTTPITPATPASTTPTPAAPGLEDCP
jgi:protein phosphatase